MTKRVKQLLMFFKKILAESNRKPNKLYVDKGSKFFHKLMKSCLINNDKEKHPTHNERKSVFRKDLLEP